MFLDDSKAVSWTIKKHRPNRVPGYRKVWELPELQTGQTACEENQHCFYFMCRKCSPLLALDTFNTLQRTQVEYIPAIANIKRPNVFEEEFRYHGEVYHMYMNYFAQISGLKGVAINGWSNRDAEKIFESVEKTFERTKGYERTLDFEIDWLLFSG